MSEVDEVMLCLLSTQMHADGPIDAFDKQEKNPLQLDVHDFLNIIGPVCRSQAMLVH
jgi:hypothetical protein